MNKLNKDLGDLKLIISEVDLRMEFIRFKGNPCPASRLMMAKVKHHLDEAINLLNDIQTWENNANKKDGK